MSAKIFHARARRFNRGQLPSPQQSIELSAHPFVRPAARARHALLHSKTITAPSVSDKNWRTGADRKPLSYNKRAYVEYASHDKTFSRAGRYSHLTPTTLAFHAYSFNNRSEELKLIGCVATSGDL